MIHSTWQRQFPNPVCWASKAAVTPQLQVHNLRAHPIVALCGIHMQGLPSATEHNKAHCWCSALPVLQTEQTHPCNCMYGNVLMAVHGVLHALPQQHRVLPGEDSCDDRIIISGHQHTTSLTYPPCHVVNCKSSRRCLGEGFLDCMLHASNGRQH